MNDELQELQSGIVAAVQQELTRYSQEVKGELDRLRADVASNATARQELEQQVRALAGAVEQSQAANEQYRGELQGALESRLDEFSQVNSRRHDEMTTRLGKVIDDANVGISATVEAAARPVVKQVETRQEQTERELVALRDQLEKFDAQAGQIVAHVNQVGEALDGRIDDSSRTVMSSIDERLAGVVMRVDEVSALAARQQSEIANVVADRVESAEVRVNEKLVALESRVNDEIGQRVADIDAHVGHISASLDDTIVTLSDRIQKANEQFESVQGTIAAIREEIAAVDGEAIEEMKDQISSALGQAELVRIEVDRFKDEMSKGLEATNVRLTELETTVQDQTLDVETAVQLERLEEVERAVLMLDPDQFVRHEDLDDLRASAGGSAATDHQMDADAPTVAMTRPADHGGQSNGIEPSATEPFTAPSADPAPAIAGSMRPPGAS